MNRGIGLGIGLGFVGNTGGGGGEVVSYLLRTDFSLVASQPVALANAQVLAPTDEPTTGVLDGSITVHDTSSGFVEITGDELSLDGGINTGWDVTGVYGPDAVARTTGRLLYFKVDRAQDSSQNIIGLNTTENPTVANWDAIRMGQFSATPVESVQVWGIAGERVNLGAILAAETIEYINVFADNDVVFTYIKTTTTFPTWTLFGIFNSVAGALYWQYNENPTAGGFGPTTFLPLIPETLYPDLIAPIATLTTSIKNVFADIYIKGVFTTPASGVTPLEIKFRQSDADNYWLVKVTPGTAGVDLSLHTVEAGVEQASLATSDIDYAISTEYIIDIVCNGDAYCEVSINGITKLSLSTTETFNELETGLSQVEAAFTSISLQAYQQSGVTIDV